MNSRSERRKVSRTPEEQARLRAVREQFQREKPTLEQLEAESGEAAVTLGEYLELRQLMHLLRRERERQGLTLAQLAERTGIDQAALSRLETGRQANTTLDTVHRIAAALGKRVVCALRDQATEAAPT
jgi:DNA-binding Xre family transcriptional regulator